MKYTEFIDHIQRQVSELAVGASALRNQGGSGLIKAARTHFKATNIDLYGAAKDTAAFLQLLDNDTAALQAKFPIGAQHWGAARKAMNLFLRDACYNRFLSSHYGLGRIEQWLEVPIDNDVATGLIDDLRKGTYSMPSGFIAPNWTKIKTLTNTVSASFQIMAQAYSNCLGIARVHVDLLYWRQSKTEQSGQRTPHKVRRPLPSEVR